MFAHINQKKELIVHNKHNVGLLLCFIVCTLVINSFSLNNSSSLLQLEMEDGDEIDAMLHQTGGSTI